MLTGEDAVRLEMTGTGFEIVSGAIPLSPYHLLAASLASCTALTLQSWATGARLDIGALAIDVAWTKASTRPSRVESIEMTLRWPGLPNERVGTAERVADLCPIHATLKRASTIVRRVAAVPVEH